MKIFKNPIFMFILGVFVSSGFIVFAEYIVSADKIEYAPNVSVKDKIDDLYAHIKPAYTGSTTITPSKNTQTLNTNNKLLNSNITINPIPSNFADLSVSTITNANDIISGKKAFMADGTLLTGTGAECIRGSFVWQDSYSTNGYKLSSFDPTYFVLSGLNNGSNIRRLFYYNKNYNTSKLYSISLDTSSNSSNSVSETTIGTSFRIDNGLILKWSSASSTGQTYYYMVCK